MFRRITMVGEGGMVTNFSVYGIDLQIETEIKVNFGIFTVSVYHPSFPVSLTEYMKWNGNCFY